MAFPSTLSSFSRPTATNTLNSPSHSALHNTVSSAVGQLEAVVGLDGANSVLGTVIGDLRSPGSAGGGHVQTAIKGGTGQTSFSKGDTLAAQSSSVLGKINVGADGSLYVADSTQNLGIKWATPSSVLSSGIANASILVFSASSIKGWTKPSLLAYVIVEAVGGGGGGGSSNNNAGGGSGGGSGTYARRRITASLLGASEDVTIGAGGASATNGGTTVFGASSFIGAVGGLAGNASAGNSQVGGAGGVATVGYDFSSAGGDGHQSAALAAGVSGSGGASYFGGGGSGRVSPGAGNPGNVFGSGGGGGVNNSGGSGAGGVIIVTNYFV